MAVNKLYTVCMFILVVEMCERLTYYSFAGSQRNFLQLVGFSNAQSTAINGVFGILTYLTCILGGWVADAKLGRYKTILLFAIIYCIGTGVSATATHPAISNKLMYLISVLSLVTLGTGGMKPNISNFGGDQYDLSIPEEAEQQQKFFSYFYLMINIGAGAAYGYMVTLATSGQPPAIPKEYGFFASYGIAALAMFVALIVYVLGTKFYVIKPPGGDSLRGLGFYIFHAAKTTFKGKVSLLGWFLTAAFLVTAIVNAFITNSNISKSLAWVLLGCAGGAVFCLCVAHVNNEYMDNLPEQPENLLTLKEAQSALDVVPTLLIVNVCFSIGYNSINGPFQSQACQMNLLIKDYQLNGAFFSIGDCFAIVLFVPIIENIILPYIEKLRNGKKVSGAARLVAGLVVTALAMAVATGFEILRRNSPVMVDGPDSNCAPAGTKMSDISAFIMFIPYSMIGIGEVLVNPHLLYFTYDQTPPRARSLSQAFNMVAMGALSNGFTTAITLAMVDFYTDDLNDGHIEYLYYISAAAALIGIPLTFGVQHFFIKKDYSQETIDNGYLDSKGGETGGNGVVFDAGVGHGISDKK